MPRDRVFEACEAVPQLPTRIVPDPAAVDACCSEVFERLQAAKSPVLMVGVETRRFGVEQEVIELARRLDIPTVTTFMGRGLLVGKDVPLQGTYMGVVGDARLARLVESSDALFLLGVLLSDTNFGLSERKIDFRTTVLACDGQVSLGYHTYPGIPLPPLWLRP